MKRVFEELEPISKEEASAIFSGTDEAKIINALLRCALYEPDLKWVQEFCLHFLESASMPVKKAAILSLSHLARIHKTLDVDRVIPALLEAEKNEVLQGAVEDTLEDLAFFCSSKQ